MQSSHHGIEAGPVPALQVAGLSSAYGGRAVLAGIDFSVRQREIFVIMGASGAGKTTLLRHVLGLTAPTTGTIDLLGERRRRNVR